MFPIDEEFKSAYNLAEASSSSSRALPYGHVFRYAPLAQEKIDIYISSAVVRYRPDVTSKSDALAYQLRCLRIYVEFAIYLVVIKRRTDYLIAHRNVLRSCLNCVLSSTLPMPFPEQPSKEVSAYLRICTVSMYLGTTCDLANRGYCSLEVYSTLL